MEQGNEKTERKEPEFLNPNPSNISLHDKFLLLRVKFMRMTEKTNNRKRTLRQLNKLHADSSFAIKGLRAELRDRNQVIVDLLDERDKLSSQVIKLRDQAAVTA